MPSNARVDAIGVKLRDGVPLTDEDEADLDEFLRTRNAALAQVMARLVPLAEEYGTLPPSTRMKTRATSVEKLRRESMRLTQIQDIAGARLVLEGDLLEQDALVAALERSFPDARRIDRRESPSQGYRAVHLIVRALNCPVEIQVRTRRQHQWAELFERLADRVGRGIRYTDEATTSLKPSEAREVEALLALGRLVKLAEEGEVLATRLAKGVEHFASLMDDPNFQEFSEDEREAYASQLAQSREAAREADSASQAATSQTDVILRALRGDVP